MINAALVRMPFPTVEWNGAVFITRDGREYVGDGSLSLTPERIAVAVRVSAEDAEALERPHSDNHLVAPEYYDRLRATDGTWACERALSIQTAFLQGFVFGPNELTYRFYDEVVSPADAPADGEYYRVIFRGAKAWHGWEYEGNEVVISVLDGGEPLQAAVLRANGRPSKSERDAMWLTVSLLDGFMVQRLADEVLTADGASVKRWYRVGGAADASERNSPFDGVEHQVNQMEAGRIQKGFANMIAANFRIERLVSHLLLPTAGHIDLEGLHLLTCIHAALSEWERYWKRKAREGNAEATEVRKIQRRMGLAVDRDQYRDGIKKLIPVIEVTLKANAAPADMNGLLADVLQRANRLSMDLRIFNFLEGELGMTLSDEDKRALGYRNELAHQGGFRESLVDIVYELQSERHLDVQRLRNIANEMLLRLCGYAGVVRDFCTANRARTVERADTPFA